MTAVNEETTMGTIQHACVLSGLTLGLLMGCAPAPETKPAAPEAAKPPATGLKPSRSGYAEVSGARFHYQIYGDLKAGKTPLLVLHGGFMSADSMMPVIQVFATTRPVIALDARGHGRTGDLPGPLTYEQMADDADAVLDALKVPSADVIGYSMGGITAIVMAARHPDKTGKQIILSGASRRDGFYPEVHEAFKQATPAAFA
jgi:pimeloyl-ACP methyl ester carboxylesterase